jgi:hypothetical protein
LRGGLGAAKPFDDGDTVPDPRAVGARRDVEHAEHVKSRGRVSELARPTWPQGQAILSIIGVCSVLHIRQSNKQSADGERRSRREGGSKAAPLFFNARRVG